MTAPRFNLLENRCLFCQRSDDEVLFPQRLQEQSISGFSFSARRKRRTEHYRIVRCRRCNLVRSDPVLPPDTVQKLYVDSQFLSNQEAPFAARTYADLVRAKLGPGVASGRVRSLLEVGSSNGFFLDEARDMGFAEVLGFEPSLDSLRKASPWAREHTIPDIYRFESLGGGSFDLAACFHVVDHLLEPLEVFRDLYRALEPGGWLLTVCHDVEAMSAKLLRNHSPIFDVEHTYLFSRDTLGLLYRESGFVDLEIGPLANTYPVGYWMRMLPILKHFDKVVPERLQSKPVTLMAGNLFAWGRKPQDG